MGRHHTSRQSDSFPAVQQDKVTGCPCLDPTQSLIKQRQGSSTGDIRHANVSPLYVLVRTREVLLTEFKRTNKHEGTHARALNAMLTELA